MGQVRNALRGLIHVDASPCTVLSWLDAVVGQLGSDEELVTLVYGLFDPTTGDFEWSSAAHMPLLLVDPSGARFIETDEFLPLGMGGDRANERLRLEPGQALVLFSDGLVESRARPLVDGLDQLAAHARGLAEDGLPDDPEMIRDRLVTLMIEPSDNDDVTVLVLRRPVGAGNESSPTLAADILLPGRATSAGAGRQFLAARLAEWQLDHLSDGALVCVSEVITNAVVHAGSHAELSMRVTRGVLRVGVRDVGASAIPTVRPPATPDDTHGRGLLLVEALSDKWGTIEEGGSKVVWFEMSTARETGQ
jgi:anti-sigma regulatory factor (Ser/Thr protein kinase)